MDIKEEKKAIRTAMSKAKKELLLDEKISLSKELFAHVENLKQFKDANTILLYYSLKDEVQTEFFLDRWYGKKRIILPVVVGDDLVLKEYSPQSVAEGYQSIVEPQQEAVVDAKEIQFAIIPGVAFDSNNNRLGRGKGFYDRFLSDVKSMVVGVCFEIQMVAAIPLESFDKPMDAVITEKGVKKN